jgi:trehalose/maltose hydrolase-like predicted phosphorylase
VGDCAILRAGGRTRTDHASLDIALAFALYANVTGRESFLLERAWPVLSGLAEWIKTRVTPNQNAFEIRDSNGDRRTGIARTQRCLY